MGVFIACFSIMGKSSNDGHSGFAYSIFFLETNPIIPNQYLRGSVSQVFPKWQKIEFIKKEATLKFIAQPYVYKSKEYQIYSLTKKEPLFHCLFLWEQNLKKEIFFIEVCGNRPSKALVEFSFNIKRMINKLPKEFYEREKAKLFLREKNISIHLPFGFSSIGTEEGRVYFVDNSGAIQGEVFSQQLSLAQASLEPKRQPKAILQQEKHWQVQTKASKDKRTIYLELFKEDSNGKKNLQFFSYILREGKMVRITWSFHYLLNRVHERNLLYKLEKDISNFFSWLQ